MRGGPELMAFQSNAEAIIFIFWCFDQHHHTGLNFCVTSHVRHLTKPILNDFSHIIGNYLIEEGIFTY